MSVNAEEVIPVDITSDEMQWDDNKRIAYAIGNASAVQGTREIKADKLIVYLEKNKDANEIILIKAEGNIIFTTLDEMATGEMATYDFIKNTIIIKNNVSLKKNDSIMNLKKSIYQYDINCSSQALNTFYF